MREENETDLVSTLNPAISKYVALRRYIEGQQAALKVKLQQYAEAKERIGAYLSATLAQNKIKRIGGDAGTAFNSDIVRYKVVDGRAYLNWLMENDAWETAKIEPIPKETDAVASKAFEDWREAVKEGHTDTPVEFVRFEHFLPPGVSRTVTTIVKVRASGEESDD